MFFQKVISTDNHVWKVCLTHIDKLIKRPMSKILLTSQDRFNKKKQKIEDFLEESNCTTERSNITILNYGVIKDDGKSNDLKNAVKTVMENMR
jgi:hypothetical protein